MAYAIDEYSQLLAFSNKLPHQPSVHRAVTWKLLLVHTKDESRLYVTQLRGVVPANALTQIHQDYESRAEDSLPIIGVYTCLFCERSFSRKTRLKRHYRRSHEESLPNYEGEQSVYD